MTLVDWVPALALVAILGGFGGWAWLQARRLRLAVKEAASRMDGRYEPGGRFSGGTLFVKSGGRDIVFTFDLAHSSRSASTSVVATLAKPLEKEILLKGVEAVSRAPRLAPYAWLLAPVRIHGSSNLLSVRVSGIVRRADQLVELASIVSALAADVESTGV